MMTTRRAGMRLRQSDRTSCSAGWTRWTRYSLSCRVHDRGGHTVSHRFIYAYWRSQFKFNFLVQCRLPFCDR